MKIGVYVPLMRRKISYLLESCDGKVGKVRMKCGDDHFVFGKYFGRHQPDPDRFAPLRSNDHDLLQTVAVKTDALNSHIILSGSDAGNCDALVAGRGKHLVNDAGAGVIVPVEDDEDGISFFHAGDQVFKSEPGGAGIR